MICSRECRISTPPGIEFSLIEEQWDLILIFNRGGNALHFFHFMFVEIETKEQKYERKLTKPSSTHCPLYWKQGLKDVQGFFVFHGHILSFKGLL